MKQRFVLTLLAGLVLAAAVRAQGRELKAVVDGNNEFAIDLYHQLGKQPGNKFFSPYSISTALAMTYAGAKGQTAKEMADVLHFAVDDGKLHASMGDIIRRLNSKDKDRPFQLTTVNRLWVQDDLKTKPDFLRITQNDYQSGLQLVNFKNDAEGSRSLINRWVEEQTKDKIKELLKSGAITQDTRLVLTNAIYFKADWLTPFTKEATRPEDFTIPGSPAFKTPMMNKVLEADYVANDDCQIVQLPYKGGDVSMVVILPKKTDGLAAVEKKLTVKSLQQDLAKMKSARVHVMLPKFKMTEDLLLNDPLNALGMRLAFNKVDADFSGIADKPDGNLYISKVIHKAFVEVDEKGTEAAAATAVIVDKNDSKILEHEPIPFRADHPFLFVIRHNETGSILFMGRLHDPR